jgi:tripartite-type tricarboxylate transporter receptor subunit TctC
MSIAMTRRGTLGSGALLAGNMAAGRARAALPVDRVARMVTGWSAGSAADIIARLYAERLRGTYAQQVIVDNRPGAAARLAVEAVKLAAPDGATMLMTPESMLTIYPHTYSRTLRYDGLRDLMPVSGLCASAFAFAVSSQHPARDVEDFAAWARTRGDIPYASPAAGSTPHFIAEQLGLALRISLEHVSYSGGTAGALPDLQAGRIAAYCGVLGSLTELQRSGYVRILAVSSAQRVAAVPQVPTFADLNLAALTAEEWYGVLLPAGTPSELVNALSTAIQAAAAVPDMREALLRIDQRPLTCSPEEFAERIRSERDRWGPIVRQSNYRAE